MNFGNNAQAKDQTLTQLEDSLIDDPLGQARRSLLDKLAEAANALGRQQKSALSPDAYARLERQRLSCLAAMEVIDRAWQSHHGIQRKQFR